MTGGIVIEYYKDGNLKAKIHHKKGKAEGVKVGCFGAGTVSYKTTFKNNLPNGISKMYFPSGH